MRIFLLLLVALAAIGESQGGSKDHSRLKRDVLLRSKRRWVLSTIELEENMEVEYPFKISTMFNDKTIGKKYKFEMSGDGVHDGLFSINDTTGDVYVHRKVDREEKEIYHITFDVWDKSTNTKMDRELSFDVEVKDINDKAPMFTNFNKTVNVDENTEEGFLPASMEVTDRDMEKTDNSKVSIRVVSQNPAEPKINVTQIDDRMARLTFKGCFDYDKAKQFKVKLTASDHGKPPLSTTEVITLNIVNKNNNAPKFKQKQYEVEAVEMTTHDDILRIAVEDKDAPNTDGWKAKYYFISGNEEEIYSLRTDPKTNECILSVVKEKNYNQNTLVNLTIGAENVEPLSICKDNKLIKDPKLLPPPDSVNVTVKMLDTNDAPVFEEQTKEVYQVEESEPGQVLYTPKVQDIDSSNVRFVMVEDPAGWMSLDEKTGKLTTTKKMNRESPFVDENNIYRVAFAAIDDGTPPATSTCTIKVHLRDINDNTPKLVNSSMIFCDNKVIKIMVPAEDSDAEPFSGPFIFTLKDDKTLKRLWKLDPAHGEQAGLVALKSLERGNYSIPLLIQDKQNMIGHETLEVEVCDCGGGDVCVRTINPCSTNVSDAAIGTIILGLLLFLLLLVIIVCYKQKQKFQSFEDQGQQSLIHYNEEGMSVDCKAEPVHLIQASGGTVTDGIKQSFVQKTKTVDHLWSDERQDIATHLPQQINSCMSMGMDTSTQQQRRSRSSYDCSSRFSMGLGSKRSTVQISTLTYRGYVSSNPHLQILVENSIDKTSREEAVGQENNPIKFAYEGEGSRCGSLDELAFDILDGNLSFLDHLGPRFNTLAEMCNASVVKKTAALEGTKG
ncbi:transcript variant X2 [Nothobranchius furzeri]|uniref:Transcript variant X2 n=1 Tax=Nothobranchius furzeri TaxID=105023 RepID=A0A9D2XZR8_NOTFU|nr:transcript variant X2 [Nothobranchius furzeri]